MRKIIAIIIAVAFSASFFINSIFFTQEATRRSADDVAKIRKVTNSTITKSTCLKLGGIAKYEDGHFIKCESD